MTVFVAGGTGTLGVPLVRALVMAGHHVVASTRTPDKQGLLHALGATPVVVDAFDIAALKRILREAAPEQVIHQLTALPKTGVRRASDVEPTNRLRDEGTRNLLDAAIEAGARRFIGGSFAILGAAGDGTGSSDRAALAVRSMETQILDAARTGAIEGIVLRYGLFYGPGNPATQELVRQVRKRLLPTLRNDNGRLPFIHLDDAVSATVLALERGSSGSILNIVDDRPSSFGEMVTELARLAGAPRPFSLPGWLLRLLAPYAARMLALRLTLSNADARRELGWAPRYPSYRDGLPAVVAR